MSKLHGLISKMLELLNCERYFAYLNVCAYFVYVLNCEKIQHKTNKTKIRKKRKATFGSYNSKKLLRRYLLRRWSL